MHRKKVLVKWIVLLYISIENNKCLNNPTENMQNGKVRKTILIVQTKYTVAAL